MGPRLRSRGSLLADVTSRKHAELQWVRGCAAAVAAARRRLWKDAPASMGPRLRSRGSSRPRNIWPILELHRDLRAQTAHDCDRQVPSVASAISLSRPTGCVQRALPAPPCTTIALAANLRRKNRNRQNDRHGTYFTSATCRRQRQTCSSSDYELVKERYD